MERKEVDLDHHTPEFLAHRFDRYAELRRECPVAFNTANGGFWMITGYEGVHAVARDNETFAHKFEPEPEDGVDYIGIIGVPRPANRPKVGIAETDGPVHADLRRALNPWFAPAEVEKSLALMEAVATWFADAFIEKGSTDLVLDFTTPVPAVLTLKTMGLPCGNWEHFAEFFHATSTYPPGSPEYTVALGNVADMRGELLEHAESRRRRPTEDLTSFLVDVTVDGRALTDIEISNVMWNLVAGGLDTTTSLASWALHHLGTHPDIRRRLIDEPALVPSAIEEYLRYYTPNETLSRTCTRDIEIGGQTIKRGDPVLISWVSANHDETEFPAADEVIVDRADNRHLAFGLGGHRCIGSHVARTQTAVMLREVLNRLPDYEVDAAGFQAYPANGVMTGVATMPVTFTPGPRAGGAKPPF
ncbi:MAG TPA: cytochrome P450 [Acidimicrobiales bacterium]|nr:cytochrome P450 [Acidimicrobiales bacterium]